MMPGRVPAALKPSLACLILLKTLGAAGDWSTWKPVEPGSEILYHQMIGDVLPESVQYRYEFRNASRRTRFHITWTFGNNGGNATSLDPGVTSEWSVHYFPKGAAFGFSGIKVVPEDAEPRAREANSNDLYYVQRNPSLRRNVGIGNSPQNSPERNIASEDHQRVGTQWREGRPAETQTMEAAIKDSEQRQAALEARLKAMGLNPDKEPGVVALRESIRKARVELERIKKQATPAPPGENDSASPSTAVGVFNVIPKSPTQLAWEMDRLRELWKARHPGAVLPSWMREKDIGYDEFAKRYLKER